MTSASLIPVIDMAPFYDGDKAEVSAVVDAARRACEEIGFRQSHEAEKTLDLG